MKKKRLAILTSHPIQYQAPFHRLIAESADVEPVVFFGSDYGVRPQPSGWGPRDFKWDVDLLGGYESHVLRSLKLPKAGLLSPALPLALKRGRFDALLVYGYATPNAMLAMAAAKVLGIPILMRGDSNLIDERTALVKGAKDVALRGIFGMISGFLHVGERNREYYEAYGVPKEKLFFAPHAVDNDRFRAAAEELASRRNELRANLGIAPEDTAFVFAAVLVDKKRPVELVRAFARARLEKAALVMCGSGPLLDETKREAAASGARVVFTGFKNQQEIAEVYASGDVFVLPSGYAETWGLAVNEAMCFALPAIVSDRVGCAADLVEPGKTGWVFPAGDTEALSATLVDAFADPERRRALGRAALARVSGYSFEADIEGLRQALSAVVG